MFINFEDLHPYAATSQYVIPNEDHRTWRELLKSFHVGRVAGICSGGEIGLFSLLPLARKDVVLVDHSYGSLGHAMTKYGLLQERGWRDAYRLITSPDAVNELYATVKDIIKCLPDPIKSRYESNTGYNNPFVGPHYGVYSRGNPEGIGVYPGVPRVWKNIERSLIKKAVEKLDRVSFIHGDLSDLIERGPFDVLYISNALEHSGRSGAPVVDEISRIVKKNGLIVSCDHGRARGKWMTLKSEPCRYSAWRCSIYRNAPPSKKLSRD